MNDYTKQIRIEIGAYIINRHVEKRYPIESLIADKEGLRNSLQLSMGLLRKLMNKVGRKYLERDFMGMSEYKHDSGSFRKILDFLMDEAEQPENNAV